MIKYRFFLVYLFLCMCIQIDAQTDSIRPEKDDWKRYALVIGNSSYQKCIIKGALLDAKLISDQLKILDFEVTTITDADLTVMKKSISSFYEKTINHKNAVTFFYFSGLPWNSDGNNYLIPVDAELPPGNYAEEDLYNLERIFDLIDLNEFSLNFIVLEASRPNCIQTQFKSFEYTTLSPVIPPGGIILAYSASPKKISCDNPEDNGLFTTELVIALQIPNLKMEEIFRTVRKNVYEKSEQKQIPWEHWSVDADFYFNKE